MGPPFLDLTRWSSVWGIFQEALWVPPSAAHGVQPASRAGRQHGESPDQQGQGASPGYRGFNSLENALALWEWSTCLPALGSPRHLFSCNVTYSAPILPFPKFSFIGIFTCTSFQKWRLYDSRAVVLSWANLVPMDIWECLETALVITTGEKDATDIWWVGTKNTEKYPTMHKISPTTKDLLAHNVKMSKAEAEKICSRDIWHHDLDLNQNIKQA